MMLDMHSSNRKVIIGASSTYVLTFLLFFVNVTKMLRFLRSEMEIEALTRNGEMRERDVREREREREGGREKRRCDCYEGGPARATEASIIHSTTGR
jgi:hypothetical protein